MKRLFTLLALLFFNLNAWAQFDAVKKVETSNKIRTSYFNFVKDKGYSPEIDDDGDIKFTYNDKTFYITIDQKDDQFFRIARLANLKLEDPAKIALVKSICHDITRDVKTTKVYWLNGIIWTSSELILAKAEDYQDVFDRSLRLTESTYLKFVKIWTEKQN